MKGSLTALAAENMHVCVCDYDIFYSFFCCTFRCTVGVNMFRPLGKEKSTIFPHSLSLSWADGFICSIWNIGDIFKCGIIILLWSVLALAWQIAPAERLFWLFGQHVVVHCKQPGNTKMLLTKISKYLNLQLSQHVKWRRKRRKRDHVSSHSAQSTRLIQLRASDS